MVTISFSWDDGAPEDIKLAALFEKYAIPCKLFVPTKNREGIDTLTPNDIKSLSSELISFGGHTYNHVYLTELPLENAKEEVLSNVKYLEDTLGKKIEHFCFPGGKYTPELIRELQGSFVSLRTADIMCSNFSGKLRKPTFHFYPRGNKSLFGNSVRNQDKIFFPLLRSISEKDYFDKIKNIISKVESSNLDYKIHIWGHSWEIEDLQLWNKLEDLLNFLKINFPQAIKQY